MLHGSFANGRYTSTVLFVLSMLVLAATYWVPASVDALWQPQHPYFMSGAVSRMLSVLMYIPAALLLSRQTFFDRAVKWKGALYLWFVALSTFANGNATVAFAALFFLLSFVVLLFTQYATNTVGMLFTSFMLLGVLSFIVPHSLYFLPLYLLFCSMTNTLSVRGVAASLLGLLTPFWLVMGTAYVLPGVNVITESFMAALPAIFDVEFPSFSLPNMLLLIFELSVLLPAMFLFVGGTSPAKPLLRRRLSFVIVACVYLMLLCLLIGGGAPLFYACLLPFVAILASYVLARKETKLLNIYFVILNVLMIAIAISPLWLNS